MAKPPIEFSGAIPAVYDAHLGPIFFEFSGADLAQRVAREVSVGRVLEVACGTGISTEFMRRELPTQVEILATDINSAMLDFARQKRGHLPGVVYAEADATALPFVDGGFDAVACQFGLMFFPDLNQGLREMRRVLRPGGYVACSIWGTLDENRVAKVAHETIGRHFESDPPQFMRVPFGSLQPEPTHRAFVEAGFEDVETHVVEATIERPSAMHVATGAVRGNPNIVEIEARGTVPADDLIAAVADALVENFGPEPLQLDLRAYLFSGRSPA